MELNTTTLAIFAVVATLGIIGVTGVNVILTLQEIDAAPPPVKGCRNGIAANASQARCLQG